MIQKFARRLNLNGNSLKSELLRGISGGLGVRAISLLTTLLLSVILARTLGPANYGIYVFVLSIMALLALPVQAGLPMLVIRETANAMAVGDWIALHSIRVWALRIILGFGTIVVAGVLIWTWISRETIASETQEALLLATVLIVPIALTGTYGAVLRGLRRVVLGQFPSEVLKPVLICFFLGGILIMGQDINAVSALGLNIVATLLTLVAIVFFTIRALPSESRTVHTRVFKHAAWGRSLLPLGLMSSLHLVNQNADLVMLGLLSYPEEVGKYKIAASGAGLITFGLAAIQIVAMPYVSRFFVENDRERLQRLAAVCAGGSILIALPIFLTYLFFGHELIGIIYGPDFVRSWKPLIILSSTQMINCFFGIVWPLLVMTGHERVGAGGLAVATIANLVLNILMIPVWGAVGAAVATGISIVIWNILFWFAVKRYLGIDGALTGLLKGTRIPT